MTCCVPGARTHREQPRDRAPWSVRNGWKVDASSGLLGEPKHHIDRDENEGAEQG
jgi:hypothetical protein